MKPVILLTNDDGYDSPFLSILSNVLSHHFDLRIVAPKSEKSWIAKAITRRETVQVEFLEGSEIPTWLVEGTPADCVNLALGNILKNEDVRAVVSGINIGFNVSLPIILSSGTVGAALEGSLMGVPGVALSQVLSQDHFEVLQHKRDELAGELEETIRESSLHSVAFIQRAIEQAECCKDRVVVHNINFPIGVSADTPIEQCSVAQTKGASIFEPVEKSKNAYVFKYAEGENIVLESKTDLNCLQQGHISYSILDYSKLSQVDPLSKK